MTTNIQNISLKEIFSKKTNIWNLNYNHLSKYQGYYKIIDQHGLTPSPPLYDHPVIVTITIIGRNYNKIIWKQPSCQLIIISIWVDLISHSIGLIISRHRYKLQCNNVNIPPVPNNPIEWILSCLSCPYRWRPDGW